MDIDDLPNLVLEIVFSNLNQYGDLENVRLVCRRWYYVASTIIAILKKSFLRCNQLQWELHKATEAEDCAIAKRCSHSSCYNERTKKAYIFGGCTDNYTAFNDLWSFDLATRSWSRELIKSAPFPRPKAMSLFISYKQYLILHGGFAKSSPNPIHQAANFFSEIHMYDTDKNEWVEFETENTPPAVASHCGCVVNNSLIIFGGSQNSRATNAVYVLDIESKLWHTPSFKKEIATGEDVFRKPLVPPARYGSSCVLIDESHLLVVGGCGGPNCIYSDAWLLKFDLTLKSDWEWRKIEITNPKLGPSQLWCHPACSIGRNLACISYAREDGNHRCNAISINSRPTPVQVSLRNLTHMRGHLDGNLPIRLFPRDHGDPTFNQRANSIASFGGPFENNVVPNVQASTSSSHYQRNNQQYVNGEAQDARNNGRNLHRDTRSDGKRIVSTYPSCVYILDTSKVLKDFSVCWRRQEIDVNAPDDTILYSLCAGRGELIMFGGMRSDMLGDKRNPFTHTICNDVYILSPARSL